MRDGYSSIRHSPCLPKHYSTIALYLEPYLYNHSFAAVVATTSKSVTSNSYIVVALQYVAVPSVAIMVWRYSCWPSCAASCTAVSVKMTSFARLVCACVSLFERSAISKGANTRSSHESFPHASPPPGPVIVQRRKFEAFPLSPFSSSFSFRHIFAVFCKSTANFTVENR